MDGAPRESSVAFAQERGQGSLLSPSAPMQTPAGTLLGTTATFRPVPWSSSRDPSDHAEPRARTESPGEVPFSVWGLSLLLSLMKIKGPLVSEAMASSKTLPQSPSGPWSPSEVLELENPEVYRAEATN